MQILMISILLRLLNGEMWKLYNRHLAFFRPLSAQSVNGLFAWPSSRLGQRWDGWEIALRRARPTWLQLIKSARTIWFLAWSAFVSGVRARRRAPKMKDGLVIYLSKQWPFMVELLNWRRWSDRVCLQLMCRYRTDDEEAAALCKNNIQFTLCGQVKKIASICGQVHSID